MRSMPPPGELLHMADAGPALASSTLASDVRIGEEPADDGNRPKTDADEHIFRFTEGNIKTLARAIIFATQYIDSRAGDASDEDVAALEEISAELKKCSIEEKNCLIQAAKELGVESWLDEMGID